MRHIRNVLHMYNCCITRLVLKKKQCKHNNLIIEGPVPLNNFNTNHGYISTLILSIPRHLENIVISTQMFINLDNRLGKG